MAKCEMKFSCRFHYTKIRGLYDYNINALRCLTPPGIDGTTVSVSVSINSQDYTYVGQLEYKSIDLNSKWISIQSGPTTGNTNVTVRNFVKILKRDALRDNLPQLKQSAVKAKIQYIRAGIVTRNYNRRVSMLKNKIAATTK